MKKFPLQGRTLALLAVIIPLLALFIYVGLRSGPLAPVAVTLASVESRAVTPALFGIGTVETRYTYKIGPTFAGRIKSLDVHVGDQVKAGQLLGEMDPVDLDDRVRSQGSALKSAQAALREAQARQSYAETQAHRYERLRTLRSASEELASTKRQELQIAEAALSAAREELGRARANREGLVAQRSNLRLIAPVDGIVATRDADPGTTIVAGQSVVEVIDPTSFWVSVRFDQVSASGLAGGLPAHIVLRSRSGTMLEGHVLRVEPRADAVTEEILAKVIFNSIPQPLPPLGELAEVTVELPTLAAAPVVSNAAIHRNGDSVGVWTIADGDLHFTPVKLGAADLDGYVQVREGLKDGDQVVTYSEKALTENSRFHVVDRIPGVSK
ncbi:MAG: efflux transporter periplasmic adaptor subunit [Betaproteobacteria bacterium HGW-Betaproteobacteria-13]|jgi:RND family efflux transporter MFP subunit|uniref:Efflux transporter periplasmic adaptor subunit n=1 Tax=Parazoarcus communis TaxID=41977 RepID=A0A2U8H9V6_9RHOO|nr:efflux RND transporter periplasmic adaptor subunit [Parazoarcus communis]AWI81505.1 efflux transporter periplasmic adaptor subunit [Parazoarcus communis]PKO82105.1 MAG: efflux transporter periplasmic adaptor subunit [Betaproteobacteria bacterium HGW-Betaproteobacteria-13]